MSALESEPNVTVLQLAEPYIAPQPRRRPPNRTRARLRLAGLLLWSAALLIVAARCAGMH